MDFLNNVDGRTWVGVVMLSHLIKRACMYFIR